jgi:hypothetical protein
MSALILGDRCCDESQMPSPLAALQLLLLSFVQAQTRQFVQRVPVLGSLLQAAQANTRQANKVYLLGRLLRNTAHLAANVQPLLPPFGFIAKANRRLSKHPLPYSALKTHLSRSTVGSPKTRSLPQTLTTWEFCNVGMSGYVGMSDQDSRRAEAKRLSLEKGWTQEAIALHFNMSTRTIERWAAQDGWGARKQAQKVVAIGSSRKQTSPTPGDEPVSPKPRRQRGAIDEMEIIESAIVSLDALLSSMGGLSGDDRIDTRGIGGTASALVKLLEYRRKIQPPTAAELADLVIELGISPTEFVAELKQKWLQRA